MENMKKKSSKIRKMMFNIESGTNHFLMKHALYLRIPQHNHSYPLSVR